MQYTLLLLIGVQALAWQTGLGLPKPSIVDWLHNHEKIIGGSDAERGEFPWQVSIQERQFGSNSVPYCGGAILDERHIATAAHCLIGMSPSGIDVVAGAHSVYNPDGTEQTVQLSSFVTHPNFDTATYDFDIAVLVLSTPLSMNNRVRSIPLADSEASGSCVSTGWGNIRHEGSPEYPEVLQKVTLDVVGRRDCEQMYEQVNPITAGMVCAAASYKGTCGGDSGGPLACKNGNGADVLAGVVSWGREPCAQDINYPSVFTNVYGFASWIQDQL